MRGRRKKARGARWCQANLRQHDKNVESHKQQFFLPEVLRGGARGPLCHDQRSKAKKKEHRCGDDFIPHHNNRQQEQPQPLRFGWLLLLFRLSTIVHLPLDHVPLCRKQAQESGRREWGLCLMCWLLWPRAGHTRSTTFHLVSFGEGRLIDVLTYQHSHTHTHKHPASR